MNNRYTFLDVLIISLIILFLIGGYFRIVVGSMIDTPELLAFTGVWLIASFLIILGVVGACRGVPRHRVKVPKMPAIAVFSVSSILFLIAIVFNGGL